MKDSEIYARLILHVIYYTRGLVIMKLAQEGKLGQCIGIKLKPDSHNDKNQLTGVYLELKIIKSKFFVYI